MSQILVRSGTDVPEKYREELEMLERVILASFRIDYTLNHYRYIIALHPSQRGYNKTQFRRDRSDIYRKGP